MEAPSLTLTEARQALAPHIKLDKALNRAVEEHTAWGLPQACSLLGLIPNVTDYRDRLLSARISDAGIEAALGQLNAGQRLLTLFDPGGFTLGQWCQVLLTDPGYVKDTFLIHDQSPARKIPRTALNVSNQERPLENYRLAYGSGSLISSQGPRLVLTPKIAPEFRHSSGFADASDSVKTGVQFLDPELDLMLLRSQLDTHQGHRSKAIGRLSSHVSRYPFHALPDGRVLYCDVTKEHIFFYGMNPSEEGLRLSPWNRVKLCVSRLAFA